MYEKINNTTFLELKSYTNQIVDLENYPNLMTFSCGGIGIIKSIINIPDELYELDCEGNVIECLDGLGSDLAKLNCSHNKLISLNNLPVELKWLNCSWNKIKHLDMIPEGLEYLDCSHNKLEGLENLPHSLIVLICNNNIIQSIDYLPTSLTDLVCDNNKIWGLTSLPSNLVKLYCSSNNIDMFVKLDGLGYLEEVDLSNNKITGIGMDLSSCNNLRILNCSRNNIGKIPELPDQLEELHIHFNPLDTITHLPTGLEIIGVDKNLLADNIVLSKNLVILSNTR